MWSLKHWTAGGREENHNAHIREDIPEAFGPIQGIQGFAMWSEVLEDTTFVVPPLPLTGYQNRSAVLQFYTFCRTWDVRLTRANAVHRDAMMSTGVRAEQLGFWRQDGWSNWWNKHNVSCTKYHVAQALVFLSVLARDGSARRLAGWDGAGKLWPSAGNVSNCHPHRVIDYLPLSCRR